MKEQNKSAVVGRRPSLWRRFVGGVMVVSAFCVMAFGGVTLAKADDISDTITSVSGYETAAVAIGIAILLFVLGRKVVRRLICLAIAFALLSYASMAHATGPDDITTVVTSVGGYETAAVAIGIAILLFVIGRKVVRRLI